MRDDKSKAPGEGRKPQKKLLFQKKTVRDLVPLGRANRIKGGQKPSTLC
jgi:hypothetical protein